MLISNSNICVCVAHAGRLSLACGAAKQWMLLRGCNKLFDTAATGQQETCLRQKALQLQAVAILVRVTLRVCFEKGHCHRKDYQTSPGLVRVNPGLAWVSPGLAWASPGLDQDCNKHVCL
eukprot:366260-Chlamydomonas_euryale.AAC.26